MRSLRSGVVSLYAQRAPVLVCKSLVHPNRFGHFEVATRSGWAFVHVERHDCRHSVDSLPDEYSRSAEEDGIVIQLTHDASEVSCTQAWFIRKRPLRATEIQLRDDVGSCAHFGILKIYVDNYNVLCFTEKATN